MRWYLTATPKKKYPENVRIVHNFWPGPPEDPGLDKKLGLDGFRVWVTDEPNGKEQRCYCGWLDGREHYGTVGVVHAGGDWFWLHKRPQESIAA